MKKYDEYKESGIEWLGEVPNHWEIVKLSYLLKKTNSGEVIDKTHWNEGKELLYTCKITPMKSSYSEFPIEKRTKSKDLLLTRNGTPYIHLPKENSLYSNVVQRISLKEKINHIFARNSLSIASKLMKGNGDIIESFNMELWKNVVLPLPTISEQLNINEYLIMKTSQIDAILEKKKELIANLKEYRHSLITEVVTKGLNKEVEMKDSGIEWIGDIPKQWEIKKLKHLKKGVFMYGANESAELEDKTMPRYIRITDMKEDGTLKEESFKSLPLKVAKPFLLEDGDLLLARSGATVGKSFLYKKEMGESCFAGYLIRFKPNKNKIHPQFAKYFTESAIYKKQINETTIKATIQNVNAEKYGDFILALPDISEQKHIIEFLNGKMDKINKVLKVIKVQSDYLEEYRQSLISEVVTGKRKV